MLHHYSLPVILLAGILFNVSFVVAVRVVLRCGAYVMLAVEPLHLPFLALLAIYQCCAVASGLHYGVLYGDQQITVLIPILLGEHLCHPSAHI